MIEKQDTVPYILYDESEARHERRFKRILIALIISIIVTFATNAMWLHYISSCDIETYEYTQDGSGVNTIGDGNTVGYNEPAPQSPGNP